MNLIAQAPAIPPIGPIATQITFLVIALGFCAFVNHAWKRRKDSKRLKSFFLGGATLGPDLTEHTTLGIGFAWANASWFWVFMGFTYGPWVGVLQLAWVVSLTVIGLWFTKIHRATRNRTIHGFLGACFGPKVRVVACIATSLGYIFNTGFELYWSGKLFAFSYGQPGLKLGMAFLLAFVAAVYCGIGGFKANASTDKAQNLLGVLALAGLALWTAFATSSSLLRGASVIFAIGSLAYIVLSLLTKGSLTKRESQFHKVFSISMAVVAVLASLLLTMSYFGLEATNPTASLLKSSQPDWHFTVGMVGLMLLFNVVDMANWQSVAANGDVPESQHAELGWAFIRSGLYITWFPTLGGTIIGLALRAFTSPITDDNNFQAAFSTVLPGSGDILRGLVLGVLFLGFLCTTLSSADSYLMAAAQTLTYDLFNHEEVDGLLNSKVEQPEAEERFVRKAKVWLLPLSLFMVFFFWQAYERYKEIGGNVLDFQFIMYAFAISLFAPVMLALSKGENESRRFGTAALFAISAGIIAALTPYVTTLILHLDADHRAPFVNLTPLISLVVSSLVFVIGVKLSSPSPKAS